VALRAAPQGTAVIRERAENGRILYVTCAVPGDSVVDQDRESRLWLRTRGGSYASLLYLQVQGRATMPNCQPGEPVLALTINGNN
jgi:hypothetical protein